MGPLMIGGGWVLSTFLRDDPEIVVVTGFSDNDSEGVRVAEESRVDFLETVVEVERESVGVVYGFG